MGHHSGQYACSVLPPCLRSERRITCRRGRRPSILLSPQSFLFGGGGGRRRGGGGREEDISMTMMVPYWNVWCYCACRDPELYSSIAVSPEPHVPPVSVHQLIQQSSGEAGWDNTVVGGGVLSSTQASKVLCRLAHEIDRYSFNVFTNKFINS